MLLPQCKRPLNESEVHYELKQIAKYILKRKGYSIIGEEVIVGIGQDLQTDLTFNKNANYKSIIDVIGLKTKGTYYYYKHHKTREYIYRKPTFQCIGIEAKTSLEDFKNGFCCKPEKVYIIAPKDIIPIHLVPKDIGLLEIDLDNYNIKYKGNEGFIFEGIYETVKPKIRIDKSFVDTITKPKDNLYYQTWCEDMMRTIAYRHTNDDLFKNNKIPIQAKKWSGNKLGDV
ncbi:hypothetical protein ACR77J_07185 [Tissierella praeacuta]|uniref:hypothetical protein n=1 Tax=Tissierella praeacuta TaxID=43131 RepID=UPI003DA63AD2